MSEAESNQMLMRLIRELKSRQRMQEIYDLNRRNSEALANRRYPQQDSPSVSGNSLSSLGGASTGAFSTTQMASSSGGLANSLGVASVPGGIGNASAAGGTSAASGAGGSVGGAGFGAFGPAAAFAALIGAGKLIESENADSPLGRGLLSGLGPSISQIFEDPKLGAFAALGVPFLGGIFRSKKASRTEPEWAPLVKG